MQFSVAARQFLLLHQLNFIQHRLDNLLTQRAVHNEENEATAADSPYGPKSNPFTNNCSSIEEIQQFLQERSKSLQLTSVTIQAVPADYYAQSLGRRAELLSAPNMAYLCKSVIMENTRWAAGEQLDRRNPRYICVVVQYVAKLHKEKLSRVMINYIKQSGISLSKSQVNYRLAEEEVSNNLTGYYHNGVTVIGMLTPLLILISDKIIDLPHQLFYLGAGHVQLKLSISTQQFLHTFHPIVADITA
jgi:prolyl-tRNA editing enzyme YbaK/EbsC (Cys-tRNA(Pro) deacylase)